GPRIAPFSKTNNALSLCRSLTNVMSRSTALSPSCISAVLTKNCWVKPPHRTLFALRSTMPNDTDVLRQQRQLRELSASVTRALADDPAVYIRQHHFFKAHRALNQYAPHLRLQDDE